MDHSSSLFPWLFLNDYHDLDKLLFTTFKDKFSSYLRILRAFRVISIHSSASHHTFDKDRFFLSQSIFKNYMFEAKDATEQLVNKLTPGLVFTVLEQDRRNFYPPCGSFLTSWRRTLRLIPSSNIECCFNMSCSRRTQRKGKDSLLSSLFWQPAPPLSTKCPAEASKLGTMFFSERSLLVCHSSYFWGFILHEINSTRSTMEYA